MNRTVRIISIGLLAAAVTACGHQEGASAAGADAEHAAADSNAAPAKASASTAKADGGVLDACSLVTQTDAESILETPAKLSEREKDDKNASHCSYEAVDQTHGVNRFDVEISTNEDANEAKTGLGINRKMYASDASANIYLYEPLTGIGDDAFMVSNKPPAGMPAEMLGMISDQQMVFAIKGARDIHIITSYSGKPRTTDTLKALAKKLADNI